MEGIKMSRGRKYDKEYREQAIKLVQEIGVTKAAKELGISKSTIATWNKEFKCGYLAVDGCHTPAEALSLNEELIAMRKQLKLLEKENKRLKIVNEFLEEASAFFAASRQKSGKRSV